MDRYIICSELLCNEQPTVTLREKGCEGIVRASVARDSDVRTVPGEVVHVGCRSEHVNPRVVKGYLRRKRAADTSTETESKCVLRSNKPIFDYKEECLFSGRRDIYGGRRPVFKLIPVRTMPFGSRILKACNRYDTNLFEIVQSRVRFVHDLSAVDAVYHNLCSVNFVSENTFIKYSFVMNINQKQNVRV